MNQYQQQQPAWPNATEPTNRTTCRSCGAPILILTHARTHKPAPIDIEPTPDGNLTVNLATNTYRHAKPALDGAYRWKSHFATCPQGHTRRQTQ